VPHASPLTRLDIDDEPDAPLTPGERGMVDEQHRQAERDARRRR
jgi:hypothetical protein